jgi:hypothetical protein
MKMKTLTYSFVSFIVAVAIIQFFPVKKTNPPVETEGPAPTQVKTILHRACYDCHSNETVWPWYSKIAPVSWLVTNDVHEGRGEINFSTWNSYSQKKRYEVLGKVWKEVKEDNMPPLQYRIMHQEARLTAEDKTALRLWATGEKK